MVFVLDNYDSFTYNLVQYMGELGAAMVIRRNDEMTPEEVEAMRPERILISPGPCTPEEAGISIALIRHFAGLGSRGLEEGDGQVQGQGAAMRVPPILGVCLGHQAIGAAFGGNVVRAAKLMHGKTSEVEHDGRTIFAGIPSAMTCTRYHSLIVSEEGLPRELEVSAWTAGEGGAAGQGWTGEGRAQGNGDGRGDKGEAKTTRGSVIMGLRHRTLPIEGVQFHPESVLTVHGKQMIANFLRM